MHTVYINKDVENCADSVNSFEMAMAQGWSVELMVEVSRWSCLLFYEYYRLSEYLQYSTCKIGKT
jgi:hypothetical protein